MEFILVPLLNCVGCLAGRVLFFVFDCPGCLLHVVTVLATNVKGLSTQVIRSCRAPSRAEKNRETRETPLFVPRLGGWSFLLKRVLVRQVDTHSRASMCFGPNGGHMQSADVRDQRCAFGLDWEKGYFWKNHTIRTFKVTFIESLSDPFR